MGDRGLTRRSLIGRGAAGAAAVYAGGAIGAAEPVFAMRVGAPGGEPLRAPRLFELLGIEWERPAGARIDVRVRSGSADWSPWLPVPVQEGHGPDRARDDRLVSDPVWTGPADWLQLRSSKPLRGATIHFVDPGGGVVAAAAPPLAEPRIDAGPGQPRIIARRYWADRRCRPRDLAGYGAVDYAAVHHTVSANYYTRSQSPAIVRSICLFHRNVRGWDDIGYNFVVDRFGQVFEGRAGGIDEPVVGAHSGGFNLYSTGIATLGTFSFVRPSTRAFDALVDVVAWKLALHGTAARGTAIVRSRPSDSDRYRTGTAVRVRRISGHRDTGTTECPGNALYARLPRLRDLAERAAGPISSLTIAPVAPITALPAPVQLAGALTSDGEPVAGAAVEVQVKTRGGRETVATATTGADGAWSAAAELLETADVRALYRGGTASAVVSPPAHVGVSPQILLAARAGSAPPGGTIEFYGGVRPAKERVTLVVARRLADGTLETVRSQRVAVEPDGLFSRVLGFAEPGDYQVIAHTAADAANATGTSPPVSVTVS